MSTIVVPTAWFLLQIDRSKPFDPVTFFGDAWTIAEQDERALTLSEVNLLEVWFDTMFHSDETLSHREERLKRLIAPGKIRLDAKVLQTLWENKALIPEDWKNHGTIYFEGTIIRGLSDDGLFIPSLAWYYGMWHVGAAWWGTNFKNRKHSACLIV